MFKNGFVSKSLKLTLAISLIMTTMLFKQSVYAIGSCPMSALRFSSTSNRIYVTGGGVTCTIAELSSYFPKRIIQQTNGIFLLRSSITIVSGAELNISGPRAGGTVNEVRLLSNNSTAVNSTVDITADYGKININSTKISSWDEAAAGPDLEYASFKRAFIRVRSKLVNNIPQVSTMNINDSDIGYLGYNASESYGVVWKVSATNFDQVDVLGDITNSRLHHNYFGAYTYGAHAMRITNNEFDNNVKYGLDPHDDSDYLTITGNNSHHNGNHGIICSKRCNNLTISNNTSSYNVGHGIMLHRSVDNSVIENNTVKFNSDAGIALFESNNNVIRGNILEGNKNSLRLSVGASYNRFENNTVISSTDKAIYTYKGSDIPVRGDGINRGNIWVGNIISRSKNYVIKLNATDQDRFENNDFRYNPGAIFDYSGATNTVFIGNSTDPGVVLP